MKGSFLLICLFLATIASDLDARTSEETACCMDTEFEMVDIQDVSFDFVAIPAIGEFTGIKMKSKAACRTF